ncbi:hypothetical protein FSP39_002951 [Pinctada imbricata]|uniref:Ima1 N-terminal domain-containing protein n=1 Tax=Pinctada imbricata TaxID=66713 RepID=A0AA88YQG6_PINIB|nr:hypothetical protein FSP39_002951 [Pinctada imbricata]
MQSPSFSSAKEGDRPLFKISKLTGIPGPKFPLTVSCWFCGSSQAVPYNKQNSWVCVSCEQYNGFTEDGDYNKPIPAQYDIHDHAHTACQRGEYITRGDMLCQRCSNNQVLKVKQLANFVPLHNETYDSEIEAFRQHIEMVYRLCYSCQAVVDRELDKQDYLLQTKLDRVRAEAAQLKLESAVNPADSHTRLYRWCMDGLTRLQLLFNRLSLTFILEVVTLTCAVTLICCECGLVTQWLGKYLPAVPGLHNARVYLHRLVPSLYGLLGQSHVIAMTGALSRLIKLALKQKRLSLDSRQPISTCTDVTSPDMSSFHGNTVSITPPQQVYMYPDSVRASAYHTPPFLTSTTSRLSTVKDTRHHTPPSLTSTPSLDDAVSSLDSFSLGPVQYTNKKGIFDQWRDTTSSCIQQDSESVSMSLRNRKPLISPAKFVHYSLRKDSTCSKEKTYSPDKESSFFLSKGNKEKSAEFVSRSTDNEDDSTVDSTTDCDTTPRDTVPGHNGLLPALTLSLRSTKLFPIETVYDLKQLWPWCKLYNNDDFYGHLPEIRDYLYVRFGPKGEVQCNSGLQKSFRGMHVSPAKQSDTQESLL